VNLDLSYFDYRYQAIKFEYSVKEKIKFDLDNYFNSQDRKEKWPHRFEAIDVSIFN